MQTTRFFHTALKTSAPAIHAARWQALLTAVQALLIGQRLGLSALGRRLPRKIFAKHAIKCLDRLLGNPHLHRERRLFYTEITRLLLGTTPHPVILVDWSPIDDRGRHFLLRAAIPFGQRAFPVYERVHHKEGCPVCQRALLDDLSEILPGSVTPILITDAGFKTPWLRAVTRHGWYYVGRVRGAMQVQLPDARRWQPLATLHARATRTPKALGRVSLGKTRSLTTRLYLVRRPFRGRKDRNKNGTASRAARSRKAAKGHREPWVLVSNLSPRYGIARKVVALYGQRMTIEEGFRDLKNERYGLELNLHGTRQARRIEILLLIALLANFRIWACGLRLEKAGKAKAYQSNTRRARRSVSIWRLGCEADPARYQAGCMDHLLRLMRREAEEQASA